MEEASSGSKHHFTWKVRFIVAILMLVLASLGMIFTDIKIEGVWVYWRVITPVYALLSIGLSLYLRHLQLKVAIATIWHEILHWIGLLLVVYLVSLLVEMGFISRFQAGVEVLCLLALATFLAGVYIEPTFLVVGIALGLLVLGVGILSEYLYALLVPLLVISALLIFWVVRRRSSHQNE